MFGEDALAYINAALQSRDEDTRREGSETFLAATVEPSSCGELIHESRLLSSVIYILSDACDTVRRNAVTSVLYLSQDDVLKNVLRELGCIAPLMQLLSDSDENIRGTALEALTNLVMSNPFNKEAVVDAGGVDRLVSLLSDTSSVVQGQTAFALGVLAKYHSGVVDTVMQCGGMEKCVELLNHEEKSVLWRSAFALATIYSTLITYSTKSTISSDSVPGTEENAQNDTTTLSLPSLDVQLLVSLLFAALDYVSRGDDALLPNNSRLFPTRRASILSCISAFVATTTTCVDEMIRQRVTEGLGHAILVAESCIVFCEVDDFLTNVIQLLNDNSSAVKCQASIAISHLAKNDELKDVLSDMGCIEPLLKLLGDTEGDVRGATANAIAYLVVNNTPNKDIVLATGGIDILVSLLLDSSAVVLANAAFALGTLSWRHANNIATIASVEGIDMLITLLSHDDNIVRWRAAGALATVSDENTGIESMCASNHVATICNSLVSDPDEDVRELVSNIILRMAKCEAGREAIESINALPQIAQRLEDENYAVIRNVLDALWFHAHSNSLVKDQLRELCVLPPVLRLLNLDDDNIKVKAMELLQVYVIDNATNILEVHDSGAVSLVVKELQHLKPEVRLQACNTVNRFVDEAPAMETAVREADGIVHVVNLLQDAFVDNKTNAARTIALLSLRSMEARHAVRIAGGVDVLSAMVNSVDENLRFHAAQALAFLSDECIENQVIMAESGCLSGIVKMLDEQDSLVIRTALVVLQNIAFYNNESNQEAIRNTNALEPIMKLLQHPETVVKINAVVALRNIACDETSKRLIQQEYGIGEVSKLMYDEDENLRNRAVEAACIIVADESIKDVTNISDVLAHTYKLMFASKSNSSSTVSFLLNVNPEMNVKAMKSIYDVCFAPDYGVQPADAALAVQAGSRLRDAMAKSRTKDDLLRECGGAEQFLNACISANADDRREAYGRLVQLMHEENETKSKPQPPAHGIVLIPSVDVMIMDPIRNTAFSSVFRGVYRSTEVAVKMLRGNYGQPLNTSLDLDQEEITILAQMRHPRILMLLGVIQDLDPRYGAVYGLVTEFMPRGSLYDVLHSPQTLPDHRLALMSRRLRVLKDVTEGMRFLHESLVMHRDLKSPNVLLDADGNAKICDFGASKMLSPDTSCTTSNIGSTAWSSPESLFEPTVTLASDVYSFGVIAWEAITMQIPWQGYNAAQISVKLSYGEYLPMPASSNTCPESLINLVEKCLQRYPASRPSFNDLFESIHEILLRCLQSEAQVPCPAEYMCPISYDIMRDPVFCSDGHTYERANIESWLIDQGQDRSPLTNNVLEHKNLTPNHNLKKLIDEYLSGEIYRKKIE